MFKIGDLVECTPFRGEPARLGFVTSHILLHGEGAIRVVYLTPFNAHFIAGVQIDHWFSAPFYGVRLVSSRSTNHMGRGPNNQTKG